jgi:nitrous oxide reductase
MSEVDLGRRRFLGAAAMMLAAAQFKGLDSAKARSEFTPAILLS